MKCSLIFLTLVVIFSTGCTNKAVKISSAESDRAIKACSSKMNIKINPIHHNQAMFDCLSKETGVSSVELRKIAERNSNIEYAKRQCGPYMGIDPSLALGVNPQFDDCVRRVLGLPTSEDARAALIASSVQPRQQITNIYVSPHPEQQPNRIYADPFGSFLKGVRGY